MSLAVSLQAWLEHCFPSIEVTHLLEFSHALLIRPFPVSFLFIVVISWLHCLGDCKEMPI